MLSSLLSRQNGPVALAAALLLCLVLPALTQAPGPRNRGGGGPTGAPIGRIGPHPGQEHLSQWMDRHRTLTLPEQQQALEGESGFRELAPPVQQRMRDRLTQLNNMSPERRQHVIDRAEAMEHLSLQQRQQVRGAMLQLSSLPDDRRRLVAHAFRDLRETSPEQRDSLLASPRYRTQFTEQERSTLSSLIAVEPYLPQTRNSQAPTGPSQGLPGPPNQQLPAQGFQPRQIP